MELKNVLGESVEGQTKSYDSPYKEKLDKSRLGVVCLYRKHHESEPGDIDNPCMTITDCSGESSGQNPIRM